MILGYSMKGAALVNQYVDFHGNSKFFLFAGSLHGNLTFYLLVFDAIMLLIDILDVAAV